MLIVVDVITTQNPHALKFVLNKKLIRNNVRSYGAPDEAEKDPLAKKLFDIEGITSVWYSERFVTLEKKKEVPWGSVQKSLVEVMRNFDVKTLEAIENEERAFPPLVKEADEIIKSKILPFLTNDGGSVNIVGYDDHSIKLKYIGACAGCGSAEESTLKIIKQTLRSELHKPLEIEIIQ